MGGTMCGMAYPAVGDAVHRIERTGASDCALAATLLRLEAEL
jgi:hypothetical protein